MAKGRDIRSGVVVRGISQAGAFSKEEVDQDERLTEASVNAEEGVADPRRAAVGMSQQNFKRGFAAAKAGDIMARGGRVMLAPMPGNRNHCQIFGLPLKDANNLFSNVREWKEL